MAGEIGRDRPAVTSDERGSACKNPNVSSPDGLVSRLHLQQSPCVLGRQLEGIFPPAPLAENTAIGIAVMSYNAKTGFGINADYDAIPDPASRSERLRVIKTE
jgi:WS/DGAT C-terminal domain